MLPQTDKDISKHIVLIVLFSFCILINRSVLTFDSSILNSSLQKSTNFTIPDFKSTVIETHFQQLLHHKNIKACDGWPKLESEFNEVLQLRKMCMSSNGNTASRKPLNKVGSKASDRGKYRVDSRKCHENDRK